MQTSWEKHHNLGKKVLPSSVVWSEVWKQFWVPKQRLCPLRPCVWLGNQCPEDLVEERSPTTQRWPKYTSLRAGLGDFSAFEVEAWGAVSLFPCCELAVAPALLCQTLERSAIATELLCVCRYTLRKGETSFFPSVSFEEKTGMRLEICGGKNKWAVVS